MKSKLLATSIGFLAAAVLVLFGTFSMSAQRAGDVAGATTALDVYFIDVEGGQATLFVTGAGQTMLVDSGFPGERDAGRIAAVAKEARVSAIDVFVNTHYHTDHIGGVPSLVPLLPIRTFVDHGPSVEEPGGRGTAGTVQAYNAYLPIRDRGQHIVAKPGDTIPVPGLDIRVVAAATKVITSPLAGAGAENAACAGYEAKDPASDIQLENENAQSVGMVITLGRFRMLDLGDLTWNHEHDLACPRNLIGTVDVYLTTHHGQNISNLPALVKALAPRVAIMNNGARKGGAVQSFQTFHAIPGLELWQLHTAVSAGAENMSEQFIANLDETTAYYLKLHVRPDGSFTVSNARTNFSKDYPPRR